MRKNRILLAFLLSCFFSNAQHLTQGIPFDTTLFSGSYVPSTGCNQPIQASVTLDSGLFNYPDGMHFYMIFDSVYCGCAPSCPCPDLSGDTIELNAANPEYQSITNYYSFWFRVKLVGSPTTVAQNYPCQIQVNQCTCFCTNVTIVPASSPSVCSVDIYNSLTEINLIERVIVYPSPAHNSFQMQGVGKDDGVIIYNSIGKLVKEFKANSETSIDISELSSGVYSILVEKENEGNQVTKFIVAE